MGLSKICFKCNKVKPLTDYYKHKQMGDGHLNKCKDCTKVDSMARHQELLKDPAWVEKEQKRHREKYYLLEYKEKHKPTTKSKKIVMTRYKEKYPEKILAQSRAGNIKNVLGNNHHWSYNEEHHKDVIDITSKDHAKAHRFIIYDQEQKMYRKVGTFELLDTKERHLEWINFCIKTKED
jgi:hypothetical protein